MPQPLPGLQAASETRRAKDKALGYLALRSYGSQELYEKLCLKFDGPSSAAAVAEMQRLGLWTTPPLPGRAHAIWPGRTSRQER